jgi:cyclopropane fatty-acyl-phospholipid synthase-like methyltransferase
VKCRHCASVVNLPFLDLGFAPPSNAYLTELDLLSPEKYYALKVMVCSHCMLVQTQDFTRAEDLFRPDYAYFSSTSTGWLDHAQKFAEEIIDRLKLNASSNVIEVASNDGYLLKNFVSAGIPCLGIEPTASTAETAEKLGIPVIREFFVEKLGQKLAREGKSADLIVGNNVFAHVPDINDFTRGIRAALKPEGSVTLEFPHLLKMIENTQFDTAYHEHFSYLSLASVSKIFSAAGLKIWNVEKLTTHGGSLRVYGCRVESLKSISPNVEELIQEEIHFGLQSLSIYEQFQSKANEVKDNLLSFLIEQKKNGKRVVAYGAAAKGNTLLNYAGVKPDLLPVVYDAAIAKQGKFMPGSHIPIFPPADLVNQEVDYLLILPWNISAEIIKLNAHLAERGTKFVTAVPHLVVH